MICPFCSNKTKIYNSRSTQLKTQTWRRHQCTYCKKTFTTRERIDWNGAVQVKSGTDTNPYNRDHLLISIAKASSGLDLPVGAIADLTDSVELELQKNKFFSCDIQTANTLVEHTIQVLSRFDTNLALQYVNSIYKNKPPKELIQMLISA